MDQLRAERMEIEAKERERTRALLSSSRFLDSEPMDSRSFHSQYNPYDTHQAKASSSRHSPPVKKHKSKKSKKEKKHKSSKSRH